MSTARLAMLLRKTSARQLSENQVRAVVTKLDVEWDE